MRKSLQLGACGAVIFLGLAGNALAQHAWTEGEYARDAITAIAPNRHAAWPSGTCTVWTNAEGLGVGPAQLDGYYGVTVSINPHPVQGDGAPVTFDTGLAVARKEQSKAPPWMFTAIEKSRAAIEAACAKDSSTPILVRKLTAKDKS